MVQDNEQEEGPSTSLVLVGTKNDGNGDDDETEWSEEFASTPNAFDAIMSDAETKKRVADSSLKQRVKQKTKSQSSTLTRSKALGRGT